VDWIVLLVESVHNYKMLLPYLRGELAFENPVMKMIVGLCLLSASLQYIQMPMEGLADPCVASSTEIYCGASFYKRACGGVQAVARAVQQPGRRWQPLQLLLHGLSSGLRVCLDHATYEPPIDCSHFEASVSSVHLTSGLACMDLVVAGLLVVTLYRLHSSAVEYKSGFWAHFDAGLAVLACTGSVALGSKASASPFAF
jgi:hypothetical protein